MAALSKPLATIHSLRMRTPKFLHEIIDLERLTNKAVDLQTANYYALSKLRYAAAEGRSLNYAADRQ
jgi:hypothetical protein